jgi:riboflavin kinase/FMN adenylyltransferase
MKIITDISDYTFRNIPSVVTIGNFDGLHLGHQKVIKTLVDTAKKDNALSVVITYTNHPIEVYDQILTFVKSPLQSIKQGLLEL